MLVSTKSLDINIDFWGFDINLKVFLGTKLALSLKVWSQLGMMVWIWMEVLQMRR
jgi:hypothetical protein